MTQLPDPYQMELSDWADNVVFQLQPAGYIGQLDGRDWQAWGADLIRQDNVALNYSPPNPYEFTDWRDWGVALKRALDS